MKKESIIIHVIGKVGEIEISPDLFDISEIKNLIMNFEHMLFPGGKRKRAKVSYQIDNGSVKNIFTTSRQEVVGFNALLIDIKKQGSIDILEQKSAESFENLQKSADETNLTYEITTTVAEDPVPFIISPETTWKRTEETWVETEIYMYGEITNAGGKSRSNIHIDTKEYGVLTIAADKTTLKKIEENMLYREYGVRVKAKQNLQSGELDTKSLRLIELIDIQKKYDEEYLDSLIERASPRWKDTDVDDWLGQLRGDYE